MSQHEPTLSDYLFELPESAIARQPAEARTDARLLSISRADGALQDRTVHDLPDLVRGDELFVFNDTRVIPARLHAHKPTGGKVELLALHEKDSRHFIAMGRASKGFKPGQVLILDQRPELELRVIERLADATLLLALPPDIATLWELCEHAGELPLPPYMERAPERSDRDRYQTVYAAHPGAVAAPTAGLHFTDDLIARLHAKGCDSTFVTLHVGPGTFAPVRHEDLNQHRMHREHYEVTEAAAATIRQAREDGRQILAVGTTVVRTLEGLFAERQRIEAHRGATEIFIREGYPFKVVNQLMTNFHLPGSTLIMLVAAFLGRQHTLGAYRHAIDTGYRFYSYGDSTLIR